MTIKQHGGVFGRNPSLNDVSVETLSIGGTAISSTATELNILDGVTADSTELNYLDGASTSVVTASKAVLANASANIAFASGNGIDFSATGDGSGTASSELFDDYEEGTWTPVVADASSGGNTGSASVSGVYTKVGRLVTARGSISNINTSGMTSGNTLFIQGLPYAVGTGQDGSCTFDKITFTGAYVNAGSVSGTSSAVFAQTTSGSGDGSLTVAAVDGTSSDVFFTVTYITA